MKKKLLVSLGTAASLLLTACSGGGEETSRNAVITSKFVGGPRVTTAAYLTSLGFDEASGSVFGGTVLNSRAIGVEEGLVFRTTVLNTDDMTDENTVESFPNLLGDARSALPDGAGGWFVAGFGLRVQGGVVPPRDIVHIKADGTQDTTFYAPFELSGSDMEERQPTVLAFEQHPVNANHLVMLAMFRSVSGTSYLAQNADQCPRIVVFDKTVGTIIRTIDLDGSCPTDAVLWKNHMVIAGGFGSIKGTARNKIGAINIDTGAVSPVASGFGASFPHFVDGGVKQRVTELALDGSMLVIGGRLTRAGQPAAMIDLGKATVSAWRPMFEIPDSVSDLQLDVQKVLVTNTRVVMTGCLGDAAPGGFASFLRTSGTVQPWGTEIVRDVDPCDVRDWSDLIWANPSARILGDTMLLEQHVVSVAGVPVPGHAWLDQNGAMLASQLPLVSDRGPFGQPIAYARYAPVQKRMFVSNSVNGGSMFRPQNFGPYLLADQGGVSRTSRLTGTTAGLSIMGSLASGNELYLMSAESIGGFDGRKIVQKFDPATGERIEGFEIDHTGMLSNPSSVLVGKDRIAVVATSLRPGDNDADTIRFYSRSDGRFMGSYPRDFDPVFQRVGSAIAVGNTLVVLGTVADPTQVVGIRSVAGKIDMETGATTIFDLDIDFANQWGNNWSVVGQKMFYRDFDDIIHVIDMESVQEVSTSSGCGFFLNVPPVAFRNEIAAVSCVPGGTKLAVQLFDPTTLEKTATLVEIESGFAQKMHVAGDRIYVWGTEMQLSGNRYSTGLFGVDAEGSVQIAPVREVGNATGSGSSGTAGQPWASTDPAVVGDRGSLQQAAGRITVSGVRAGHKSLTVGFSANGNKGPFVVRLKGGSKVCTTTSDTCTFSGLNAYSPYAFTVESQDDVPGSVSQPTTPAKAVIVLKKGKTLRLSTVIKPASKKSVKWKSTKGCTLNTGRTVLTAPKKAKVCNVSVSSRVGASTVTRSIAVWVG